jgi:outer membrane protein TolC
MKQLPSKNGGRGAGIAMMLSTGLLAACAVGPNFKTPDAPHTAGFVPEGQQAPTTAASVPGGQAQRFVDGMDIPGQWWTLFQSAPLNALIERALANSPTLQAAQAALRQANETVAAERGAYYPSVSGNVQSQRQKASGAAFGSIPGFPSSYFYNLQSASVNVSYTLDAFGGTRRQVEALQAQADYQQFALEASYLALTANIVTAAISEA